jgi:hypothetical protein
MLGVTHKLSGNWLIDAPPVDWGCAGEGESVLARTHSGRILPNGDEAVRRQALPILSLFLSTKAIFRSVLSRLINDLETRASSKDRES